MVFTLPDRLSPCLAEAAGSLQLSDMRLDGAGVTLQVRADGIDLSACPEAGIEPDPIVVPAVVPVLGGRLCASTRCRRALCRTAQHHGGHYRPAHGQPARNPRQPAAGRVGAGPRTLLRSLATGALGMITPFLIQPPMVAVSDTVATAEDFSMSPRAPIRSCRSRRCSGSAALLPISAGWTRASRGANRRDAASGVKTRRACRIRQANRRLGQPSATWRCFGQRPAPLRA